MNNIVLMGRITKNPELKYSASGKSKCNFTIAVTRKYKKDEAEETKWIYEVITDEFEFIEKKGENDNVSQTEEQ